MPKIRERECWWRETSAARLPSERRWLERVSSVFVGGIDRNYDERAIRSSLSKYGSIVDIFIPKKLNVSRGFAFVRFKHANEADLLLNSNPGVCNNGRRVSRLG